MRIFDAHNDFLTELKTRKQRKAYMNNILLQKDKISMLSQVWTTELKNPINCLKKLKEEIKNAKTFIFAIEDLGFISSTNYKKALKVVIGLKPFSCGIVWNYDNNLGGGAFGKSGLTKLGKYVIKVLEGNNIFIDCAHMNFKTFNDFVKITKKPIFNSHCNLYELNSHKRNIKPEQIQKIKESNGLICLSFVKYFISKKEVNCKNVAEHILYFVKKYGYTNIAIGSDFFGTTELPYDLNSYLNFKNLKCQLRELGISNMVIKRIFYRNLNNFIKKYY